jgi:tetratricopeptide (TPR) repeat protein
MISCIVSLYLACSAPTLPEERLFPSPPGEAARAVRVSRQTPAPGVQGDADALYARREDLASARQAEGIWASRLRTNARDFEAAWKLARVRYWLGGHAPEAERKAILEAGITAARAAVAIEPNRPQGHFWIAANMGALAESFGLRQGLKYRGDIRDELLVVLKLDPAFQAGSADRALGRWYYKVPGLFGGSKKKSEEHLRKSLQYDPTSTASLYFLAETLVDLDRRPEALETLRKLADAPIDTDWAPEDREFKAKGQLLTARLAGG